MTLLRLIGYVMAYSGIGIAFYGIISLQITTILVGAFLLFIGTLLVFRRHGSYLSRKSTIEEWLDLPFEFAIWAGKAVFKMFD